MKNDPINFAIVDKDGDPPPNVGPPEGRVFRLENPGKVPMVLIEVQTGSYLGEDDIIRYEDVYARE
jgi:hypothetical protein